jgi:hypothetical protein
MALDHEISVDQQEAARLAAIGDRAEGVNAIFAYQKAQQAHARIAQLILQRDAAKAELVQSQA